jgi:hypothetical protein
MLAEARTLSLWVYLCSSVNAKERNPGAESSVDTARALYYIRLQSISKKYRRLLRLTYSGLGANDIAGIDSLLL